MATFEGNWFAYDGDRWLEEQEDQCDNEHDDERDDE